MAKNRKETGKRAENEALRFRPSTYIRDVLGWNPWSGQRQIIEDVRRSYVAQFDRRDFMRGDATAEEIEARARERNRRAEENGETPIDLDPETGEFRPVWMPGDGKPANVFRVESGHGFGKTKLVAGLVNHAFDTFPTMAGIVYGTDWAALRDKPMREVFRDRRGKGLPGRMLEGNLRVHLSTDHFIQARSTSDSKGRGKDRLHGTHPEFWCYLVDEADAVEAFVFDAIEANRTGGIGIVLLIGNPRRRNSRFARMKGRPGVRSYRFSTHEHPNVVSGREVIPDAVDREWVRGMIQSHCQVVSAADDSKDVFRLEWYTVEGPDGEPVVPWLEPDDEYRYMVMGIPPRNATENTFVSAGVYESALMRGQGIPGMGSAPVAYGYDGFTAAADVEQLYGLPSDAIDHPGRLTVGVDVARWGTDRATVYARFRGRVWRSAALAQSDTDEILAALDRLVSEVRRIAAKPFAMLVDKGREKPVRFPLAEVVVRVDNTGGGGSGVVDGLTKNTKGTPREGLGITAVEVVFGKAAAGQDLDGENDARAVYRDLVTQMYAFSAEALKGLRLGGAGRFVPEVLEAELTDRRFGWSKTKSVERKKIEAKDKFKERHEDRSPDDGDGAVLALCHDDAFSGSRTTSNRGTVGAGVVG